MGLDVRLVVRPLGDGTLGYWTFGDWTLSHWPVTLDIRILWAGLLVRHLLLLLIRRARLRGSEQQDRLRSRNLPSPVALSQEPVRCSRP
jgi:hypothetical protein